MFNVKVDTGIAQYEVKNLGPQGSNSSVEINGVGPIHFNDLGNRKFGPESQTWGVCVTFQDSVWAFRYEGQGQLDIAYNQGSGKLAFKAANGSIIELTS